MVQAMARRGIWTHEPKASGEREKAARKRWGWLCCPELLSVAGSIFPITISFVVAGDQLCLSCLFFAASSYLLVMW